MWYALYEVSYFVAVMKGELPRGYDYVTLMMFPKIITQIPV